MDDFKAWLISEGVRDPRFHAAMFGKDRWGTIAISGRKVQFVKLHRVGNKLHLPPDYPRSMRWKIKPPSEPEIGTVRIIKKFLWFPMRIGNEWRWMERAKILQRWERDVHFVADCSGAGGYFYPGWANVAFER